MSLLKKIMGMFGGKESAKEDECCDHGHDHHEAEMKVCEVKENCDCCATGEQCECGDGKCCARK